MKPSWPSRANWKMWRQIPEADVHAAVALSVDLEPDDTLEYDRAPDLFEERIQIAWSCAEAGTLPTVRRKPVRRHLTGAMGQTWVVNLAEFGAWAGKQDWLLPESFPRLPATSAPVPSTQAGPWPWGSHDTKLLQELAAAARHWWTNYVPGKPATAPTSEEVAEWLQARGVAQRVSEIMAQILRADGLRAGPHTNDG